MRRQLFALLAVLALVAALGYGLARLFALRFERGDVYPTYSTLRTDPLGAKAFHDALASQPDRDVRRNYRPLPRLRAPEPIALIYVGVSHRAIWGAEELRAFERLVSRGSRAVFAFAPAAVEVRRSTPAQSKGATEKPDGEDARQKTGKGDAEPGEDDLQVPFKDVAKRWGFEFSTATGGRAEKHFNRPALVEAERAPGLEPAVSWHSALHFTGLAPEWKTLYSCEGKPVLVERAWGAGTIVLASDSYFMSNEALRIERRPRLLAWLAGAARTIVFDEEHHGVTEQSDLSTLIRKYRLGGALLALLLVAALFVWKNATRFLPPADAGGEPSTDTVTGRETAEGFIALLRRSIPPAEVLRTCVDQWRKSFAHQPRDLARLQSAAADETAFSKDPVSTYKRIAAALNQHPNRP
jgi:hypothetical protein